ncbi:MAG: ECF-type sigma factor [Planctomycetes bacterium]|nr:ECF-type sigma factor [Planctomycetota bacterium]
MGDPGLSQPADAPRSIRREEATGILREAEAGRPLRASELLEALYAELRSLAAGYLSRERGGHTLQPTALVHEAWLRLVDQSQVGWKGEAHFLGVAAMAMRRVLVDHARAKKAEKRGGGRERVELDAELPLDLGEEIDLVALDRALEELAARSERQVRVVELRFFGGLDMKKVAETLGIALRTAEEDWRVARAWLSWRLRREVEG